MSLLPFLVYLDGSLPSNIHLLLSCAYSVYPDSRSQDQNIPQKVWNLKFIQCRNSQNVTQHCQIHFAGIKELVKQKVITHCRLSSSCRHHYLLYKLIRCPCSHDLELISVHHDLILNICLDHEFYEL
jgi:hypothetical protein